jgi:hypothetical protein
MAGTKEGAAKRYALVKSENENDPVYVVGRRPLKMGDDVLAPGDVVPGAHRWLRLESWLRTGAISRR